MNSIEVIRYLETFYPKEKAYDWDNVGLQVGSLNSKVKKVLVTLDVTKEVVKEAIEKKVDLLISHHPLIFKPVYNVQVETPRGWIIHHLIKHGIALYSMHTNYDTSKGGMNDEFARLIGLEDIEVLDDQEQIGLIGNISPRSFDDFVSLLHHDFNLPDIKLIGKPRDVIKRIGFSLGSGSIHMAPAKRKNADLFLTGDVTYHTALDAIQMGLTILDIGHYAEKIFKPAIALQIQSAFPDIEVLISQIDTNPYTQI